MTGRFIFGVFLIGLGLGGLYGNIQPGNYVSPACFLAGGLFAVTATGFFMLGEKSHD